MRPDRYRSLSRLYLWLLESLERKLKCWYMFAYFNFAISSLFVFLSCNNAVSHCNKYALWSAFCSGLLIFIAAHVIVCFPKYMARYLWIMIVFVLYQLAFLVYFIYDLPRIIYSMTYTLYVLSGWVYPRLATTLTPMSWSAVSKGFCLFPLFNFVFAILYFAMVILKSILSDETLVDTEKKRIQQQQKLLGVI